MCLSDFEPLKIRNAEGLFLQALLLDGQGAARALIVVCHGFTGSKEGGGRTLEMGRYLLEQTGAGLLVFDFAGHGESQGEFADVTLSRQIRDLSAVVDWCEARLALPILTMGRSFGGSTVLCQAAQDHRVKSVCTWAAPGRPYELFAGLIQEEPWAQEWIRLGRSEASVRIKAGFLQDLQQHDVLAAAAEIAPRPLLVVHGEKDGDVLPREAEQIHAAAHPPKQIRIIPDADHRFQKNAALAWKATRDWVDLSLKMLEEDADLS